jgi:hypothetical protein
MSEETLDLFESGGNDGDGQELDEVEQTEAEEAVDRERERTDRGTTATPTELAGGGASENVPGHDVGPAEL